MYVRYIGTKHANWISDTKYEYNENESIDQ